MYKVLFVALALTLAIGLISTGSPGTAHAGDWTYDDPVDAVKALKVKDQQCPTAMDAEVCLKVTWYDNQALSYVLETRLGKNGDWIRSASVTANGSGVHYTHWVHLHDGAALKHNKRYWVRVAVVDSSNDKISDWRQNSAKTWKKKKTGPGGNDGGSDFYSGDAPEMGAPTEVTNFKVVEKNDGSVVVKWKAPEVKKSPIVKIGDKPPVEDVVQGAGPAERFIVQVFQGCEIKPGQFMCFIGEKTNFPLVRLKEVGPNTEKVVFKNLPRPNAMNFYDIRVQAVNSAGFSNWRSTYIILRK